MQSMQTRSGRSRCSRPFVPCHRQQGVQQRLCHFEAPGALTRKEKEVVVEGLQSKLRESKLVYGWTYTDSKVKDLEAMRRQLPEGCKMQVAKNRLLRVAVDNLEEEHRELWQGLREQKGMNMYVFVNEEGIRDAVKAFNAHKKVMQDRMPAPRNAPKPEPKAQVQCIVMDGQALPVESFKQLEKMPTKQELLQQIAVAVKQSPTRIARAVNAVPLRIAYGLNEIIDLSEDKNMTIEQAVIEAKGSLGDPSDVPTAADGGDAPASEEGSE